MIDTERRAEPMTDHFNLLVHRATPAVTIDATAPYDFETLTNANV
jgi:hypothetical protein